MTDLKKTLDAAVSKVHEARDALEKAKDRAEESREKYLDSLSEEVYGILRSLKWQKITGRGARTERVATLEDNSRLLAIWRDVTDSEAFGYGKLEFKGVCLSVCESYRYRRSSTVRVSIKGLEKLGVVLPGADKTQKAKLRKMIDAAGLTPEQLEELLAKQKSR